MKSNMFKKLLSTFLVLAICVPSAVSCLVTANAESVTGATYTITAETVHAYADEGKATITFDLESGFTGGSFTMLKDNSSYGATYDKEGNLIKPAPWNYEFSDVEIKVVGGIDISGNSVSADDMIVSIFNDTDRDGTNDAEETDANGEPIDARAPNNATWLNSDGTTKAEDQELIYAPGDTRHETFPLSNVSFSTGDVAYKSITFEFAFEWDYNIKPNEKCEIKFAQAGQYDHLGKEYSSPVLKMGETSYDLQKSEVETVDYFHSHISPMVENKYLIEDSDHNIYEIGCAFCGALMKQVHYEYIDGSKPNGYYDISAINIVYENDGTISVNVHCPGFNFEKDSLLISYTDGKATTYGDNKTSIIAGTSSQAKSPYAKEKIVAENGSFYFADNVLPNDTYVYEIKGISAKDIDKKLYLTRVVMGSGDYEGQHFCGTTQEISLNDYCVDVIEGSKVYYPEGTTDEQIEADKKLAAALINYGVNSENALNHKVSYDTTPLVITDTWDGTKVEPTTKDNAGNVIINTAEELAWVALVGGDSTSGARYKIANNQVFDMQGMQGINLDSTVAQVKTATKNTTNYWSNDSGVFKGTLDGNGAIVFNICGNPSAAFGGLFPTITANATIKNITVKASAFYGYHNSGAIVGYGNGQYTVNISNCTAENCYMSDNNNANSVCRRVAAVFVGGSGNTTTNVTNCLAVGNECSAANIEGGILGNGSAYAPSPIVMSNAVVIGTSPYPVVVGSATLGADVTTRATYSNIYTDMDVSQTGFITLDTANMKGSAAQTNMLALDWNNVWVTTNSYPAFNPYIYCTDTWDGTKVEPTQTDADGNIIINTAEELAWIALQGGSATNGKNYKVADGINYFNMNGSVGITADSTVSDVKSATATTNLWNHSADFTGNFDGNGVVVYNIRNATGAAYGGLFPRINGVNSSIKNVSVKASIIYAYHGAGAIIGQGTGQFTTTIDNCAVVNCYMTDNNNTNSGCQRSAGVFVGSSANHCIKINNCFAAGNECSGVNSYGGFVGRASAWAPGNFTFTNCISLGISPYTTAGAGAIGDDIAVKATWTNVYTDTDLPSGASTNAVNGIIKLTTAEMQGDAAIGNMPALDWGTEWFEGEASEYPSLVGEVYADTWDGTKVEPTETDNEGNIIINTAEELAWIALVGATATNDKNYKVADGIKYFNMNGMSGIGVASTATQVKNATKNTNCTWRQATDNGTSYAFGGNFDGNGVTIYNVYGGTGYGYGGLFPTLKQTENNGDDIAIKNVNVFASYFVGYHCVGAIVGGINAPGSATTATFDKCIVKNCYVSDNNNQNSACQRTAGAIAGSVGHSKTTITNCFAISNDVTAINIVSGLIGNTSQYAAAPVISNSVSIGVSPVPVELLTTDNHPLQTPMSNAKYTNVYTDQETSNKGVTTVDGSKITGEGADDAMPNLPWGIDWFTGAPGEYPCFVDDGIKYNSDEIEQKLIENNYYSQFIANFETNYNRDTFITSAPGDCDLYATGLTLKSNPYITVTFAFREQYLSDKENVVARFEVNDQTIEVKATDMINNNSNPDKRAGRYHLVRLKGINVANLCDDIKVTLLYNGAEVGTGSISVAGFGFTAGDAGEEFAYYKTASQALVFYAEALQNKIAVTSWSQNAQ